jgi:hypothetical protein
MGHDSKCIPAVEVEYPSGEDEGNPPPSRSRTGSCSTDDLRWFSMDNDGERSSIDEKTEVDSRTDDDWSTVAHDDDESISRDESGDGARRDNADKEATAENDLEPRATDNDLEGQEKTRPPPDGGAKAWLVAGGAFASLVCTFGYLNTFG